VSKWDDNCGLRVFNEIIFKKAESLKKLWEPFGSCLPNLGVNELNWLCYLAGNSQSQGANCSKEVPAF
jgi:hypothetical protein